jgi:hypothetical protein
VDAEVFGTSHLAVYIDTEVGELPSAFAEV